MKMISLLSMSGVAVLGLVLADAHGFAQRRGEPASAAALAEAAEGSARASSDSIIIRAGDTIGVTVFDTPELSREIRVSADGTVNLPLLNDLAITGLSESEAAHRIDRAFVQAKILLHPQTSVLIRNFAARGVAITGEVVHPGLYPVAGPRSLFDIIAEAGGLTTMADTRVDIKRADGTMEHGVRLPLDDGEKTLSSDVNISPGDRVIAKRAGSIFVLGEVTRPGGYLMQYDGNVTVLQAVAEASGTTRIAGENNAVLIRRIGNSFTTQPLKLREMYKGKQPDFALSAGDVIYVPGSTLRNFAVNAPEILGTLAGAAIYSVNH